MQFYFSDQHASERIWGRRQWSSLNTSLLKPARLSKPKIFHKRSRDSEGISKLTQEEEERVFIAANNRMDMDRVNRPYTLLQQAIWVEKIYNLAILHHGFTVVTFVTNTTWQVTKVYIACMYNIFLYRIVIYDCWSCFCKTNQILHTCM